MGFRTWWVWFHDLGAVVWLGSILYQLAVVAPALGNQPAPTRRRLWLELIGRFHRIAMVAAAAVVFSGFVRVWSLPWPVTQLPATPYGRLLLAKMSGAAGMLAVGAAIAFGVARVLRQGTDEGEPQAAFRWLVILLSLEAILGAVVLWCVARIHSG